MRQMPQPSAVTTEVELVLLYPVEVNSAVASVSTPCATRGATAAWVCSPKTRRQPPAVARSVFTRGVAEGAGPRSWRPATTVPDTVDVAVEENVGVLDRVRLEEGENEPVAFADKVTFGSRVRVVSLPSKLQLGTVVMLHTNAGKPHPGPVAGHPPGTVPSTVI